MDDLYPSEGAASKEGEPLTNEEIAILVAFSDGTIDLSSECGFTVIPDFIVGLVRRQMQMQAEQLKEWKRAWDMNEIRPHHASDWEPPR